MTQFGGLFYGKKKDSLQKAALREMMNTYLKDNNVKIEDGTDVNSIMRDMMFVFLKGTPGEEMVEEPCYSRYDYRNKETDNRRNGYWIVNIFLDNFFKVVFPILYQSLISEGRMSSVMII